MQLLKTSGDSQACFAKARSYPADCRRMFLPLGGLSPTVFDRPADINCGPPDKPFQARCSGWFVADRVCSVWGGLTFAWVHYGRCTLVSAPEAPLGALESIPPAHPLSKNHDEQLMCEKPPTSKNSDGFSR